MGFKWYETFSDANTKCIERNRRKEKGVIISAGRLWLCFSKHQMVSENIFLMRFQWQLVNRCYSIHCHLFLLEFHWGNGLYCAREWMHPVLWTIVAAIILLSGFVSLFIQFPFYKGDHICFAWLPQFWLNIQKKNECM